MGLRYPSTLQAMEAVKVLIRYMGDDPTRPGLLETPERHCKALRELSAGYEVTAAGVLKTFEDGAAGYDEMVFQENIPVNSVCEHHMIRFHGVAHIGYIPNKKIVGLSKLFRLVDLLSRKLQVQERLTVEIADTFTNALRPRAFGVVIQCRHGCMECRGVKVQGTVTTTTALRGLIKTKAAVRGEFLASVDRVQRG